MNRHSNHPQWCGRAHVCSHDRPSGEHRSHPVSLDTNDARFVVTRIRTRSGHDRIELRVIVDLPADPRTAEAMTRLVIVRIHRALQTRNGGGQR